MQVHTVQYGVPMQVQVQVQVLTPIVAHLLLGSGAAEMPTSLDTCAPVPSTPHTPCALL